MDLGYSLLLREYIAATEVDYGDCAEFQITCPACHEAIFKAGRYDSDRQYFSHYVASKSNVKECELRVAAISHDQKNQANIIGRGQTLNEFFSKFQTGVLEWLYNEENDDFFSGNPQAIKKELNWAISREPFRNWVSILQKMEYDFCYSDAYRIWEIVEERISETKTKFETERQKKFAKDFMKHLVAPNSKTNWAFLVALVIYYNKSLAITTNKDIFLYGNIKQLSRRLHNLTMPIPDIKFMGKSRLDIIETYIIVEINTLLLCIPYIDILNGTKDHRYKNIFIDILNGPNDHRHRNVFNTIIKEDKNVCR